MKIKQICEMTGLTDRAIRFYIEEGLITPRYTENYLGRKSFDFTDADAEQLQSIATLRKFGFTLEEIRTVQHMPSQSQRILTQVRERKQAAAGEEQEALKLLEGLGKLTDYTVPQLAGALGDAAERAKLPPEKYRPDAYEVCGMLLKTVLYALVMLAPLGFLLHWLGWFWEHHRYAVFAAGNAVCILLALLPTAVLLAAWRKPEWIRRRLRAWLLCLLYLPFSWSFAKGMLGDSVTMDIRYYRMWDYAAAREDGKLNRLFPQSARRDDAAYFYRSRMSKNGWDIEDHEVYAAWALPLEQLQQEVKRVDTMFREHEDEYFVRHVVEKGNYTCWIMDLTLRPHVDHDPFAERWTGGGYYMMFAFDAASGNVRYGVGNMIGTGWTDYPYFRTLDWNVEGVTAP